LVESKYEKYLVRKPGYEHSKMNTNPGTSMTYMSDAQVPESNCYLEYSWISEKPVSDYYLPEPSSKAEEIILFIGGDFQNPEDLGSEIELSIDSQKFKVSTTSALYLPQGTKIGPIIWKQYRHPHSVMTLIPCVGSIKKASSNSKSITNNVKEKLQDNIKINYERYLVRKPIYERAGGVKNRQSPTMTFISSAQIPESKYYIEFGWIYGIPEPNPPVKQHVHKNDELIVHFGGDWNNPEDLGGEIDFAVEDEHLISSTNTAFFAPKGLRHCPVTWKRWQKPHIEMAITIGSGSR
jgi:hypothetical protein